MIGFVVIGVIIALIIYHAATDALQSARFKDALKNGTGAPAIVTTTQTTALPSVGVNGVMTTKQTTGLPSVDAALPAAPTLATAGVTSPAGSGSYSPANGM